MSKKPARSERDVELPDWADEVTPADEVMKKFYAPTGAFKIGPINIQQPAAPVPESPAPHPLEREEGLVDNQTASPTAIEAALEKPVLTPSALPGVTEKEDKRKRVSLPSPAWKIPDPSEEKAKAPSVSSVGQASTEAVEGPQTLSFEEFASKWKRYLYPGQMAVMRTLFDLTIVLGTTECFTRYSEIAVATKMTRRNCINVMNSLVERGFVKRLEIRNDSTGKGIKLRIHTDPLL
jgi:hypothetical protein